MQEMPDGEARKPRPVDEEDEDYILSEEEEAEENRETDVFILNIMDEKLPFSKQTLDLLRRYINAFFGIPVQVQQPKETAVSPPGLLALAEKTNRPLKQRVPRLPEHPCKSTRVSIQRMFTTSLVVLHCYADSEKFSHDINLTHLSFESHSDIASLRVSERTETEGWWRGRTVPGLPRRPCDHKW